MNISLIFSGTPKLKKCLLIKNRRENKDREKKERILKFARKKHSFRW